MHLHSLQSSSCYLKLSLVIHSSTSRKETEHLCLPYKTSPQSRACATSILLEVHLSCPCCHHVVQFRGIEPSLSSGHHNWLKGEQGAQLDPPESFPRTSIWSWEIRAPSSLEMRIWACRCQWPWLLCSEEAYRQREEMRPIGREK